MPPNRKQRHRKLPPAPSPRRGTIRLGVVLAALIGVNLYVFLWRGGTSIPDVMDKASVAGDVSAALDRPKGEEFGQDEDRELGPIDNSARIEEQDEPGEDLGVWEEGVVLANDSMAKILAREGLNPGDAGGVLKAMQPHMEFGKIRAGQGYRLHQGRSGQWDVFEFNVSPTLKVNARRTADGAITSDKAETHVEVRRAEVGGRIESSLYAAIKARGEDTRLVSFFVDVFAYDLNFYIDQHKGDAFRMIVEKEYLDGQFLRYGRVVAAEWAGKAGTFRAFWYKAPNAKHGLYFDEKGRNLEKTFLKSPLKFTRVSSKFNRNRMHPVLHRRKGHFGVDYAAPTGTPVWAAAGGKITFRGQRGGAGNCVILRHEDGLSTIYMHLSKFRKGHNVGQFIRQKEVIGYVGMTGLATGPHLHFGVKKNGGYIDPMRMKMSRGAPVPRQFKTDFEVKTAGVIAELARISVDLPPIPAFPPLPAVAAEPAAD